MSESTSTLDIRHRIRHIRQVSARRISTNEIPTLYFTLHSTVQPERVIYTSETHHESRNPTWKKFTDPDAFDHIYGGDSCFILRIWGGDRSRARLLLEWRVDLNELVGVEEHRVGVVSSSNLVLFSLSNANKSNLLFTDRTLVEGLKVVTYEVGKFLVCREEGFVFYIR